MDLLQQARLRQMHEMGFGPSNMGNLGDPLSDQIDELLRISRTPWNFPLPSISRTPGELLPSNTQTASNNPKPQPKGIFDQFKEMIGWDKLSESDKQLYAVAGIGLAAVLLMPKD